MAEGLFLDELRHSSFSRANLKWLLDDYDKFRKNGSK